MSYALKQSFEIDGTGVDAHAFVLGVEWGMTYQSAAQPAPFVATVHAENAARIESMLQGAGRRFTVKRDAGWATFTVAGLD